MTINLFMYMNLFVKTHVWRIGVWFFSKAWTMVSGRGFKTHPSQYIYFFIFPSFIINSH
jgi:hypothetical protein